MSARHFRRAPAASPLTLDVAAALFQRGAA